MWRALFLAVGIYCVILGVEALAVEKAVLHARTKPAGGSFMPAAQREVVPPDWAPWSLLSGGAVVLIYSFTIPKRGKE